MKNNQDYPVELQRRIENAIALGILPIGKTFTVSKLGKQFGGDVAGSAAVIPALLRKGLLEKMGEKTFAVCGVPKAAVESVFQFAQKSKLKPRTIVRDVSVIRADEALSRKLEIRSGAPVFQQVRTRLVDEHILANQYNFIPYEICPGLEDVDLSHRSFQVTLEEDYHTVIARINETYRLDAPMRDDLEILNLEVVDQVLIVERMSYSITDMPLVYADIHVDPAQFRYVARLWPEAEDLVRSAGGNGGQL